MRRYPSNAPVGLPPNALTGLLLACVVVLLGGCDSRDEAGRSVEDGERHQNLQRAAVPPRVSVPAVLARGRQLFAQNCAACHGADAQGDPNWRFRGPDGKFPPPPLNGTGHSWHHPRAWLRQMIKSGSPPGQGNMPAWGNTLSDQDIEAIIAWFQSLWPEPVYEAWVQIDHRASGR